MKEEEKHKEREGFGELLKYTISGYLGGLSFGFLFDFFRFSKKSLL